MLSSETEEKKEVKLEIHNITDLKNILLIRFMNPHNNQF